MVTKQCSVHLLCAGPHAEQDTVSDLPELRFRVGSGWVQDTEQMNK